MIISKKVKAKNPRAYHRPEDFFANEEEDFLRKEKDELLLTLKEYIGKTKSKPETILALTNIETSVAKICKHSLGEQTSLSCSNCQTK
jgi:hypothetical protein